MWKFNHFLRRGPNIGVENSLEVKIAESHLRIATRRPLSGEVVLPDWFPVPRLKMPESGFAADYFILDGFMFCSRRFRDALAQPEDVVQFAPVELIGGGAEVRAQDYRQFRVLAHQPSMDLEKSDCEIREYVTERTHETFQRPTMVRRYVLLDGLQPLSEVFRMDESPAVILVADAAAERVLRAGCHGMEFAHPDNIQFGTRIVRYRTATGIAERKVDFLK